MKAELYQRGPAWFETALARLLTMRVGHYPNLSSAYPFAATSSQRAR
jgi:hypothetical protein